MMKTMVGAAIALLLVCPCLSFTRGRPSVDAKSPSSQINPSSTSSSDMPPPPGQVVTMSLLSVPFPNSTQSDAVSVLQRVWKWKESSLGDGANHFVGRRRRRRRRTRVEFIPVGAGVDFELLSNSLTFECRNPQLPEVGGDTRVSVDVCWDRAGADSGLRPLRHRGVLSFIHLCSV